MTLYKKKYNRYDIYIFILIASLVAGNLFGALQVPRVLAITLFLPCLQNYSRVSKAVSNIKNWLSLFILFSFTSCLWTPAGLDDGLVASVYNVVHVILFVELIIFSSCARNPVKDIIYGFLFAFAISAVIAFWELTTDQHLETSKTKEAVASNTGTEVYMRYFAAVTFYNFNMYVTFLCFTLPFLFYGMSDKTNGTRLRLVFVAATATAVILLLYNGSRGGLVAFVIMTAIYFVSYLLGRKSGTFYIIILVVLLVFVLYHYGSIILNTLIMRGAVQGAFEEESRLVIWTNVIQVIKEYYALGCGAGGLYVAMEKYAFGGITVAHNIFLELLSEYGALFFAVFFFFLVSIFKRARQIEDKNRKICLYQALFSFPIVGIINSTYLTQPVLWATMSSLYILAYYERIKSIR